MSHATLESAKTVEVNGASLAYLESGGGEPVVFVHGGISDLRTWEQQLPAVGRSYRAISYSRRFARPNEDIGANAAVPLLDQVEDLVVFLRETRATPAHLVGNSFGALISLLTAIHHPEAIRSLVLAEPPALTLFVPSLPPRPTELLHLVASRPRTAVALLKFVLGTIAPAQRAFGRGQDDEATWIFARGVLGKKPLDEIPEARREQMRENRNELRALMFHPEPEPPLLGDSAVSGIHAPVLLLTGELSHAALLRLTDRLQELLPHTERVEIPDASHLMHEENPSAVNEAILAFLRQSPGSAA